MSGFHQFAPDLGDFVHGQILNEVVDGGVFRWQDDDHAAGLAWGEVGAEAFTVFFGEEGAVGSIVQLDGAAVRREQERVADDVVHGRYVCGFAMFRKEGAVAGGLWREWGVPFVFNPCRVPCHEGGAVGDVAGQKFFFAVFVCQWLELPADCLAGLFRTGSYVEGCDDFSGLLGMVQGEGVVVFEWESCVDEEAIRCLQ